MQATERELDQFYGHVVEERQLHEATKRHEDAYDLDDLFDACAEHQEVILYCIQKQHYTKIGHLFTAHKDATVKRRVNLELGLAGNALDAKLPAVRADLAALSIKRVQA